MTAQKKSYHEFRIITGTLKGRAVRIPDLGVTRPPLTRLRKAIFDFLNPYIKDCRYLDLFSGTGSYLFEAVSRGAANAVGVELEPALAGAINEQAKRFGVSAVLTCLCDDVFETIGKLYAQKRDFDIIMVAPPQYRGVVDKTLIKLKEQPLTVEGGLILCQHDTSETNKIGFLDFEIWQRRKYGNTTFTILRQFPRLPKSAPS